MHKILMTIFVMALATPAVAVEFNLSNGTGSAKANEVAAAVGAEAVASPEAAAAVDFFLRRADRFQITCEKNGRVLVVFRNRVILVEVDATVNVNPSDHVKGFTFTGYGDRTVESRPSCRGDGWTRTKTVLVSKGPRTLLAEFEGDRGVIWP